MSALVIAAVIAIPVALLGLLVIAVVISSARLNRRADRTWGEGR